MADKKITDLTELTTPSGVDLLEIVDDPGGSPVSKKISVSTILSIVYPVGAIYISVVSTSPATLFGGTWSAFGAGRTLVGLDSGDTDFDTVEETGGAKTVTLTGAESGEKGHNHTQDAHTHTQDAHTHTQDAHTHTQNAHGHTVASTGGSATAFPQYTISSSTYVDPAASRNGLVVPNSTATNQNTTATNQNTTATNQNTTATNQAVAASNATSAHNNLQPYIVTYIWKRTA